jgi:hypothetical protein
MPQDYSDIAPDYPAPASAKTGFRFERFMRKFSKTVPWYKGFPP